MQVKDPIVHFEAIPHFGGITTLILEKESLLISDMVQRWRDRDKEPKEILIKSTSSILPSQAYFLFHPSTEHVQVQQSSQDNKIKEPHVLP